VSRWHYLAALAYATIALLLVGAERWTGGESLVPAGVVAMPAVPAGSDWWSRLKPLCNSVEVETGLSRIPPPPGPAGTGYAAACLALAGRIIDARARILDLPVRERAAAASVVFGVGHPVADMGDDRSAGPMMGLVVEFIPDHYMALYHAGMAVYTLGDHERAAGYLKRFVGLYPANDGWRTNALEVLRREEMRGR
jgi:hypothetical protein